jgi:hypothetical protein
MDHVIEDRSEEGDMWMDWEGRWVDSRLKQAFDKKYRLISTFSDHSC